MGQRLEDERPKGQNRRSRVWFTTADPEGGKAQSRSDVNRYRLRDSTVAKGLAK